MISVEDIKLENERRKTELFLAPFNPVTGFGAGGKRFPCQIKDYYNGEVIFLPVQMLEESLILLIIQAGSIRKFTEKYLDESDDSYEAALEYFEYLRCKHDFPYFCYAYVKIKNKEGGPDINFFLRPAQRKLVKKCEKQRLAGKPIRIIILKGRQWGGSTCVEVYMGWLQLFWKLSWNSIIVGNQANAAFTSKDMYVKLLDNLPDFLLRGENVVLANVKNKAKITSGGTPNISVIPVRNCKITTVSAANPDSVRGGDVSMAHCTEVAFWPNSEKITSQQLVKAACSGISLAPYTFIVYESTPNGMENFFYDEWVRACSTDEYGEPLSEFEAIFVSWFEIESNCLALKNEDEFINKLISRRNDERGGGKYLYWLWSIGATLEGINWYSTMSKRYSDPEDMKQEYPSNDVEAFRTSGSMVFDIYKIDEMLKSENIKKPLFTGDIYGQEPKGAKSVVNLKIADSPGGNFKIWEYPDKNKAETFTNAYLVSVDIGGRRKTSDYTCITVFDRTPMYEGKPQRVVAEWYGHDDPDLLAIKCAQISIYYCNALLVVERNTPDSRMNDTDGDVTELFFPVLVPLYNNLYCDRGSETDKKQTIAHKWGFFTSRSTKPAIVLNYVKTVREDDYVEPDTQTVNEMSFFLKYPNNKYSAAVGKHDDKVMSRGIGLFVSIIKFDEYPVKKKVRYDFSKLNKNRNVRYLN